MRRKLWCGVLVLGTLPCLCRVAPAVEEPFCEPPADCSDDVFSIRFASTGTSEMCGSGLRVGDTFETQVFLDVNTPKVVAGENCLQPPPPPPEGPDCGYVDPLPPITECSNLHGFGYGIKHDTSLLEIELATRMGADPIIREADFNITSIAENLLGMVSAVVITLDACPPFDIPPEVKDLKIAVVRYKVKAIPATGTKLEFTDGLNPPKSPRVGVWLDYAGKTKAPKVKNAVIKPAHAFYFGPSATAAELDLAGAGRVRVSLRNTSASLGFSLGIRKEADKLFFVGNLGLPEPRELALVTLTNDDPPRLVEIAGPELAGNSARGAPAPTSPIVSVLRGAAIAGNTGDDFFAVDLIQAGEDPDGVGVTVGYVTDRLDPPDKVIPAVIDARDGVCGLNNEILVVSFGAPEGFSRGDANGDRNLNVTDALIIAQNIFLNRFVVFDCQDMLDADDNGTLNAADPVYLLTYLFLRGPALAPPFKVCAFDGTGGDLLDCAAPNCT